MSVFTEQERARLVEASWLAKLQQAWLTQWSDLLKEVEGMRPEVERLSDGTWDGVQGFSQDVATYARKMVKLSKEINRLRDAR